MYPNALTDDSLRLRYRQPTPPAPKPRRAMQPDVRQRQLIAARQVAPVQPVAVARPVPRPAVVTRQVVTPPVLAILTAVDNVFALNLDSVPAAPLKRSKYLVKPRRSTQVVLLTMALSLFAMGGYISFNGFQANKAVAQTATTLKAAAAADAPNTTKPSNSAFTNYQVAADMPRYIRIGELQTEARVLNVGVNAKGAIGTPNNVFDAAWYNKSAKPGQPGAAFIDGHVSSWQTNGVFYNLHKASVGTLIEIERGDGTKLQYRVVKTTVFSAQDVDMKAALSPVTPGKEGLNLMTCTGKVTSGTSEFESRLLVMAERVN